jgi:hypothetical protein
MPSLSLRQGLYASYASHCDPVNLLLGRRTQAGLTRSPRGPLPGVSLSSGILLGVAEEVVLTIPPLESACPQAGARGKRCFNDSSVSQVARDGDIWDHWTSTSSTGESLRVQ